MMLYSFFQSSQTSNITEVGLAALHDACWQYVSLILPRYSVHQWMPAGVVAAAVGPLQASMTPLVTA